MAKQKRFFRYSGSKATAQYFDVVNDLIKDTNFDTYVEPFVGSGGILFNLEKEFDKYVINDIDKNIIRIYKTFKEIDYKYYKEIVENIFKEFGYIKSFKDGPSKEEAKESFYNFRNWFNKNHWNKDTIEEGIYLHMLANSCINSLLRFGPNGMNSSFGNRFYYIDEENFLHVKKILNKTEIYNVDYKEIYEKYPKALYFLDPPYFSQASSYTGFSEEQFKEFLELTKDKNFIYTDIENEYNKDYNNKIFIRAMRNTAPISSKEIKHQNREYIYTSLDFTNKKEKNGNI